MAPKIWERSKCLHIPYIDATDYRQREWIKEVHAIGEVATQPLFPPGCPICYAWGV
jgi:hypothetical protein